MNIVGYFEGGVKDAMSLNAGVPTAPFAPLSTRDNGNADDPEPITHSGGPVSFALIRAY